MATKKRLFEIFEHVTGVRLSEGDLTYAHVNGSAGPEQDQYKIGMEEGLESDSDTGFGYDEHGKQIYISGYADMKSLSYADQLKVVEKLELLKSRNKLSPIGQDILNIWYKYNPQ